MGVIRVSDATAWEHCPRHAWFLLHPPPGDALPTDPFEELVQALGEAHEAAVLASFSKVVRAESAEHTAQLIAAGVPVIYQPLFIDTEQSIVGAPDFLLREGNAYRVADAKLALSIDKKKAIKAQLGTYRRLAKSELPARVFLGDGAVVDIDPDDDTIAETFVRDMHALAATEVEPVTHYSYSKCSPCPFNDSCLAEFKQAGELTLNPAVQARAAAGLRAQGIATLADLAASKASDIADVAYLKGAQKKERAILQARSLQTGEVFSVATIELPPGDYIHFDVESDPMAQGGAGEVYLWGFLTPPYNRASFEYVWKDDADDSDATAWREFLDLVGEFRARFEKPVLVHYSPYEVTQIRRYAQRYADLDHPIVRWLLAEPGPLLDIQKAVKDAFVLPVVSYGLKSICRDPRLVDFHWRLQESGSQWSVVRYYDYLDATTNAAAKRIKQEILTYNEDDVRATEALVAWLRRAVAS